jgi:L-rhamnose-H+ transport protein
MIALGIVLAGLSGICNGLFTVPMKTIRHWKWENTWLVFIVAACVIFPAVLVGLSVRNFQSLMDSSPKPAIEAALFFGFAWGFGAICFGLSVDRLGVSLANTLVIGLSSALGSFFPLLIQQGLRFEIRQAVLLTGVFFAIVGVVLCGRAGQHRESVRENSSRSRTLSAYLLCLCSGMLSAVFNIGYTLALPIADAGVRAGNSRFVSTNCIWLLMLGAGALPNIFYCLHLLRRHRSASNYHAPKAGINWGLSLLMAVLWGSSIFVYGAATPLLGDLGPSIGWPLSLAVGILVVNLMGILLGEWREAQKKTVRLMRFGILTLLAAIFICAASTKVGG